MIGGPNMPGMMPPAMMMAGMGGMGPGMPPMMGGANPGMMPMGFGMPPGMGMPFRYGHGNPTILTRFGGMGGQGARPMFAGMGSGPMPFGMHGPSPMMMRAGMNAMGPRMGLRRVAMPSMAGRPTPFRPAFG